MRHRWLGLVVVTLFTGAALAQPPPRRPAPPPPALDGTVKGPDGLPVAGALVLVQPSADARGTPLVTRTDDKGAFHLPLARAAPQDVYVEAPRLAPVTRERVPPGRALAIVLDKGRVLEGSVRENGKPVAGARVEAAAEVMRFRVPWSIEAGVARAQTDASGHFVISGLATSRYTVSAHAAGRGHAVRSSVGLGRPVVLALLPGSSIVGAVLGPDRMPVTGASVRAEAVPRFNSQGAPRVTDARGRFELDGIPPGSYRLLVLHRDFAPAVAAGIAVEARRDTSATVSLSPGSTLRGRLLADAEHPLAGRVVIQEIEGQLASATLKQLLVAESGADGHFLLPQVPAGSLVFTASADGYGARTFPVLVGSKTRDSDAGDVTLQVGLAIRGAVRERDGTPIAGASLIGFSRGNRVEAHSQTDGSFVLAGLQAGSYWVLARAPGHAGLNREVVAGADAVELVLDTAGSIGGRVVDDTGQPLDVFSVSAQRKGTEPWQSFGDNTRAFAVADGRFSLADIGPGEWVVEVEAPEREAKSVSGVKVVAGVETDVGAIRLGAGAALRGAVVDADGAAVNGARVTARLPEFEQWDSVDGTVSDEGGGFELRGLRPGTYDVWAHHPEHADGVARGVTLDPARGPGEARIVVGQGGRIEGFARTRDGRPLASAYVSVAPAGGGLWSGEELRGTPGDGGAYAIDHVPAGGVRVRLMLGDGSRYTSSQTRQVEVSEGALTRVDFVQQDILVSGHVTRAGGPVAGLRVTFFGGAGLSMSGGPPSAVASAGIRRLEGITREDGGYELLLDEPGAYRVGLRSADNKAGYPVRDVVVPDVESYTYDVTLPGVPVTGILVDEPSQEPLEGTLTALAKAGGYGGRAAAAADGRFQFDLEPGAYELRGSAKQHVSASVALDVGESGESDVRVALPRGSLLAGRVVDSRGSGVANVEVTAGAVDGSNSGDWTSTQSDGTFSLQRLRPNPYNLLARSGLGSALRTATPGDDEILLTLRPGGRLALRVLGPGGAPVASVWPDVETIRGLHVWFSGSAGTGPDGRVELTLPAGRITGSVAQGTQKATFQAEVREGATTSLDVQLQEPAPQN